MNNRGVVGVWFVPIEGFVSDHFTLHKIREGVYAAVATDGGWAVGNAGFVDTGDDTIVFDTFVNSGPAGDLKREAERITGRKVGYVVNSHAHRDHVRGNQVFVDASVVSTAQTAASMSEAWKAREERVNREGLDSIRRGVEEEFKGWMEGLAPSDEDYPLWEGYRQGILQGLGEYRLKLPSITFDSSYGFHGSKLNAEAMTFGGGHTDSDAFLYIPETRTAFLGDLLFVGYQPYLGDGDIEHLLSILDRIDSLEPSVVVPGHGPIGGRGDLAVMKGYVDSIRDSVRRVGLSSPYDTWKLRSFYKENLKFLSTMGEKGGR